MTTTTATRFWLQKQQPDGTFKPLQDAPTLEAAVKERDFWVEDAANPTEYLKRLRIVKQTVVTLEEVVEAAPALVATPHVTVTADGFQMAQEFAQALNTKFGPDGYYVFGATKGRKYHRITQTPKLGAGMSVHAFVNNDGWVYKSDGWKAPAKIVRFTSIEEAVEAADPHGSYLYLKG